MNEDTKTILSVVADIRKRAEHAHDLYIDNPDKTVSRYAVSEMLLAIALNAFTRSHLTRSEVAK